VNLFLHLNFSKGFVLKVAKTWRDNFVEELGKSFEERFTLYGFTKKDLDECSQQVNDKLNTPGTTKW
jgi:hypothetical protein